MVEEVKMFYDDAKESMDKSVEHLEVELGKVRAGKATPSMLSTVSVDYYGTMTPLSQVSNVSTPDARSLMIKPWEKTMLEPIEKAIFAANLGFTPQNDGEQIRVNIPPLTEERRKDLVKQIKHIAEESKISIRNTRRDANDAIKALEKEGVSEDNVKDGEHEIQNLTNDYIAKIDKHVDLKEAEIMTV